MVCSKCGKCCKIIAFEIEHRHYTAEDLRYFEARGIRIERKNRNRDYEIVPYRCKYLTDDNLCSIWETRPDICNKEKRGNTRIYVPSGCTDEKT